MKLSEISKIESLRLKDLQELQLWNSDPEEDYDNIVQIASFICGMPVSLITLINEDQQWFKSKVGTDWTGNSRELSFCSHLLVAQRDILIVQDSSKDDRFANNPLTTLDKPVAFYAGVPLKSHVGNTLGTLCVIDHKPNDLTAEQQDILKKLAKQVENLFELRRRNLHLQNTKNDLKTKNNQLRDFAGVVAHDMKMPLANMVMTSDLLKAKYKDVFDDKGLEYLDYLKKSSFKLSNYISDILEHYESDHRAYNNTEEFDIHLLLEQIIDLLNIKYDCEINLPEQNMLVKCNRSALEQIFLNLIGNSLKYNNSDKIIIDVEGSKDDHFYYFSITDNGIGIPKEKQEDIFRLFTVLAETDKDGHHGNGIGLSTVQKLITNLEGEITLESKVNVGTTFKFSIKHS